MKHGGVELIGVMQMENRGLKEGLIRASFGPAIVPCIHVGVMGFVAIGVELVPLHAGMEDIQNVVKEYINGLPTAFEKMDIGSSCAERHLRGACL